MACHSSIPSLLRRGALRLLISSVLVPACQVASARAQAAPTPTVTTLSVSSSTVKAQQPVTLTATVKGNGVAVSPGQVVFCNASAVHCEDLAILGMAQLVSNGTATTKLLLPVGAHSIYAKFLGTRGAAALASSTSQAALTTVTVTGELIPVDAQISVAGKAGRYTLSSTVDLGLAPGAGTVYFRDATNNHEIASAPLDSTTAKFGFDPGISYPVGPTGVTLAADFNGDGVPDLLSIGSYVNAENNTITALVLSPGDPAHPGRFLAPQYTPVAGAGTLTLRAADLNGDGVLDVALLGQGGLIVLFGDATHPGEFLAAQTYALVSSPGSPADLCIGDFDGDGLPDIAVANYIYPDPFNPVVSDLTDNKLNVLLNDPSHPGQFLAAQTYSGIDIDPDTIATADFDGDGTLDLIIAGNNGAFDIYPAQGGQLNIYRGDPANPGQFLTPVSVNTQTYPVTFLRVGDFNGDTLPDIAVADNSAVGEYDDGNYPPPPYINLGIFINDDAQPGGFLLPQISSLAPLEYPTGMTLGDFNGDGLLDIAVSGFSYANNDPQDLVPAMNGFTVSSGVAQRSELLQVPVYYPSEIKSLIGTPSDLNGDGLTDLAGPVRDMLDIQLAQRTETATAVNVNAGSTSYAFAVYTGDSTYGPVSSCEIPLDATAKYPKISGVKVENVTKTSAAVFWYSDLATYGSVVYQLNEGSNTQSTLPQSTAWDPAELTSHYFVLTNLTPGTLYSYTVSSQAYFSGCTHSTTTASGSFSTAN